MGDASDPQRKEKTHPTRTGPQSGILSALDHRRRRRPRCVHDAQRCPADHLAGQQSPDAYQQRDLSAQATPDQRDVQIYLKSGA